MKTLLVIWFLFALITNFLTFKAFSSPPSPLPFLILPMDFIPPNQAPEINHTCLSLVETIISSNRHVSNFRNFRYVHSVGDFYELAFNHAINVELLAYKIFLEINLNPTELRPVFGIPDNVILDSKFKKMMIAFIGHHDQSKKEISKKFLKLHGIDRPSIYLLYKSYGKNLIDFTEDERMVIRAINRIDEEVKLEFIKKYNLTEWQVRFIDRLEKMADSIDRGMSPVVREEMNKTPYKESAAIELEILKKHRDYTLFADEEAILKNKLKLAKKIEAGYFALTKSFNEYRRVNRIYLESLMKTGLNFDDYERFFENYLIDSFIMYENQNTYLRFYKREDNMKMFFNSTQGSEVLEALEK